MAWLPDRTVTLHRDPAAWSAERLTRLGDSARHRDFWRALDKLAAVFWRAARRGARLPIGGPRDALRAIGAVGLADLHLARFLRWTLGDLLRHCRLRDDRPLVGLLSMLIEDTVHARVDSAPLINAALGATIRGAGLTRARGGMRGFWTGLLARYRDLGGVLRTGCAVNRIESRSSDAFGTLTAGGFGRLTAGRLRADAGWFVLHAGADAIKARQVVSAVPATVTCRIAPPAVARWLDAYVRRDLKSVGGAVVVFLGIPEWQVAAQPWTHHQLLQDYPSPLGEGNNMVISVSAPGDTASAPAGCRSVMISTHCELAPWEGLTPEQYAGRKEAIGQRLIGLARRVYPDLARPATVVEVATPRTFERFTGRPRGAVGGVRQTTRNSNQNAIPHRSPLPGFWLAGDSTWPGLGTVACLLGSEIVAEGIVERAVAAPRRRALSLPTNLPRVSPIPSPGTPGEG